MNKKICLLLLMSCFAADLFAQTVETSGWVFLSHTQKISKKFDILADAQVRTADRLKYFNTLLLRTALQYNLNKTHAVAAGYALKTDWTREDEGSTTKDYENRIYEQYQANFRVAKIEMSARFRHEQRFLKKETEKKSVFAQRSRIFFSAQIPLFADSCFSKGVYANIQDELFLNVHKKQNVNNSLFDQNRTLVSLGYRWNKKIDTEFGYQYWYQKNEDDYSKTNVFQIMITTSF